MIFHPAATLFPMMSQSEFTSLCCDIAEVGLRTPILIAPDPDDEGKMKIADGRNRYQACLETNTPLRFESWDGVGSNSKRPLYARVDSVEGFRQRERLAVNVGSNRREAVLLADGIELLGLAVKRITPTRIKWSADQLKRYTGIETRTSQHVRDAIALCWQG